MSSGEGVAVRGLVHNCIIHPVCGVIWFVADTTRSDWLARLADHLHDGVPG